MKKLLFLSALLISVISNAQRTIQPVILQSGDTATTLQVWIVSDGANQTAIRDTSILFNQWHVNIVPLAVPFRDTACYLSTKINGLEGDNHRAFVEWHLYSSQGSPQGDGNELLDGDAFNTWDNDRNYAYQFIADKWHITVRSYKAVIRWRLSNNAGTTVSSGVEFGGGSYANVPDEDSAYQVIIDKLALTAN